MVRKTRSNKKDTICEHCGHEYSMPQKLCEHFKQKNPCKLLQKQKEVAYIQTPIQVESFSVNMSNKKKPHVVIPTLVVKLKPKKKTPVFGVNYITKEEAKN
ncbi:21642_t:CDS:2 [Rhizophagus irregularis]|nr:21642_t:CDS:2 [Rhizophagus irregularis]